MKHIHILVGHEDRGIDRFLGFWSILRYFQRRLTSDGFEIKYFTSPTEKFFDADHIFLSSRYGQFSGSEGKAIEARGSFLKDHRLRSKNVCWFDLRDSAGTGEFDVLPFVSHYVKKQIYSDVSNYGRKLLGGRLYTDYYIRNYGAQDSIDYSQYTPSEEEASKIRIGWNIGAQLNYGMPSNRFLAALRLARAAASGVFSELSPLGFGKTQFVDRPINCLAVLGTNYDRESVGYQRKMLMSEVSRLELSNAVIEKRLPRHSYNNALSRSKTVLCAYGWGEVCYREFEALQKGALPIVPESSHVRTWPNIYTSDIVVSYGWDFHGLKALIDDASADVKKWEQRVSEGQRVMSDTWGQAGYDHIFRLLSGVTTC